MATAAAPHPIVALTCLLAATFAPAGRLFADTSLTSGTTTISTGTDFGANLFVGVTGTATLEVVAGGSASNGAATIGSVPSGVGTAVVTGGTWTTLGNLDVSNGSLTMSGGLVAVGGRLQNTASGTLNLLSGGTLQIGVGGTTGDLVTTGWLFNEGTLVFNTFGAMTYTGTTYGNGRFVKEGVGTATLGADVGGATILCFGGATIHSGTVVLNTSGNLFNNTTADPIVVGDSPGDAGFVRMSGGSLWGLAVSLGKSAGSAGTATVPNGIFVGDELIVGDAGTGTIDVAGGSLVSQSCVIGSQAGGVGTVTVSSGGWQAHNDLVVGGSGAGTLTITGGILTVDRLSLGVSGTINLNPGGTLAIGFGNDAGTLAVPALTNNGTLIFNRADASTYAGVISGSGGVTKQGAGRLWLSGTNTYSGLTTVAAGRLAIAATSLARPIANASELEFAQEVSGTFAEMISGTGSVTKTGTGMLAFIGGYAYTGATIISEGTLQVGTGGTTGDLGDTSGITVDAMLAINRSNAFSLGCSITGTGVLHHAGTGTTTLSGTNSYTGGTLVSAGRLVGDAASLQGDIVTNAVVEFHQAGMGTYSGMLTGSGTLEKTGGGTLIIGGSSAFAGATTISTGTLQFGDGTTVGLLGSSAITNNAFLLIDCDDPATFLMNVSSGTGSFVKQGGGVLTLTGTNASSGPTIIREGAIVVDGSGTWNTFGDVDVVNGSLTMSGGLVAVGGRLQNTASGTINLLSGGTLQIGVGGTTGELANADWLVNEGALVFNRSDASTYACNTYGNGRFVKEGAGALTLSGNVACWGGGAIRSGTLVIANAANLQNNLTSDPIVIGDSSGDAGFVQTTGGAFWGLAVSLGRSAGSAGTATVSSGGFVGDELIIGDSGTGTINVTGGSVTSQSCVIGSQAGGVGTVTVSDGSWRSYNDLVVGGSGTGTLTIAGGILIVQGTLSHGSAGTINLAAGGTLSIGDRYAYDNTRGVLAVPALTNNGTLIFCRDDATSYAGVISGSGAVTKQGAGTLSLAAINFYTGVTTISAGTLALTGTASIGTGGLNLGTTGSRGTFDIGAILSGSYALPSTGDLVGAGTITGSGKTLAVEGSFGPGNSPGTVTIDAGLTLDLASSIASTFEFTNPAFTAGTFDLVDGDGSVVYGGVLNLSFTGGSYANGTDVAQIFANTGGRSGSFTSVNSSGLAAGQSATFDPATGRITVVPEPVVSHVTVVAGLIATAWARRRRHPRRAPTWGA